MTFEKAGRPLEQMARLEIIRRAKKTLLLGVNSKSGTRDET